MPAAALVTTKRKFHKLLDSISNASSPSLTTHQSANASTTTISTSHQDSSSKRPRIEKPTRPRSAYVPRSAGISSPSIHSSPSRPKSLAATQTNPTISASGEHKKPPNFAPWDRDRFLERLKTFRFVDKWRAKPDARIGEVEWARRGWSCGGVEMVKCVGGCNEEIVIKLEEDPVEKRMRDDEDREKETNEDGDKGNAADEDDWRIKAQEQLVERYAEMISTGHAEGCLWRRRGCDDTIQRLPLVHQKIALDGLRMRYESLLAMAPELPPQVSTPDSLDVLSIIQQASYLLSAPSETTSTASNSSTDHINKSGLLLALFGWQAEDNHISGLATCTACFRRLGLWLFKSPDSSMDRLDVIGEHREYCPWVNPLSQNGGSRRSSLDGLAGWEVLLRAVKARSSREPPVSKNVDDLLGSRDSLEDGGEDAASFVETVVGEDEKTRDETDRQRWAKLKRLKQVFHVKKRPGTSGSSVTTTTTTTADAT